MKHLKMLGLSAIMVTALMASAVSAPANPLTTDSGEYTGEIRVTAESSLLLKAGFAEITCTESEIRTSVESHAKATKEAPATASGKISALWFGNCGSATVDVLATGSLEIVSNSPFGGKVNGSGSQWTVAVFGTSCVYGTTTKTPLGTIVSSNGTLTTMTISASLPRISGGFLCATPASWSGSYVVTTPKVLFID